MGQVIPDGFGQATLTFQPIFGPSNPVQVVFGYDQVLGPSPSGNAAQIRDRAATLVATPSAFANDLVLTGVSVIENPGGQTGFAASAAVGTAGEVSLPPNVAILVRKNTLTGGRRGRGRIYWPGMTTSGYLEGGALTAGALTLFQTAFQTFFDGLITGSVPMVILHDTVGPAPSLVSGLVVQNLLATQRRRLRN